MAHWLSSWRMNRSWQRLFSRASAVVGLLLVTSLAHAGWTCIPAPGAEGLGLRAVERHGCLTASRLLDACIVSPQRIDGRIAAATPSSPEPAAAAGTMEHATGRFRTAVVQQTAAGPARASPVPVYILLHRYLS